MFPSGMEDGVSAKWFKQGETPTFPPIVIRQRLRDDVAVVLLTFVSRVFLLASPSDCFPASADGPIKCKFGFFCPHKVHLSASL